MKNMIPKNKLMFLMFMIGATLIVTGFLALPEAMHTPAYILGMGICLVIYAVNEREEQQRVP